MMKSYYKKYEHLREKFESKLITSSAFLKQLNNFCIDSLNNGQIAWNLFFKSRKLFEEKKYSESCVVVDELIKKYKNSSRLNDLKPLSMAMANKSLALIKQNKNDEAISVCNDIIKQFSFSTSFREQIAISMLNKSIALDIKDNLNEAITVCNDIIKLFCDEKKPLIHEVVYRAQAHKGHMLIEQGNNDEAITVYNNIIKQFGKEKEHLIRGDLAEAMVNKGDNLFYLGKHNEAIEIYDNVIEKFKEDEEPSILKCIERASGKKYIILWKQGELDFSNTEYNREFFVASYGHYLSTIKVTEATKSWDNGNYQKAIDTFYEAWEINNDNLFIPTVINELLYKIIKNDKIKIKDIFDYTKVIDDCLPKYMVMANYYIYCKDYESALPLLNKCIEEENRMLRMEGYEEITEEILEAHHYLFQKHSKYLSSRKDINESIEILKSMYIQHNAWKAICYLEMKEPSLAAEIFENILKNFPEHADIVYNDYAISLFSSGRQEEAENILDKIDLENLNDSRSSMLFLFIGMRKLCKGNILESYIMLSSIERLCKSKSGLDVFLVHGCYHFVEAIKTYTYDLDYENSLKMIDKSIQWLRLSRDSFLLVAQKMKDIILLDNKFDSLLNCNSIKELSDESYKLRCEFNSFSEELKKDEPKQQTNLGLKTPHFYYGLLVPYLYRLQSLLPLDYALHFIEDTKGLCDEMITMIFDDSTKNNNTPYSNKITKQLECIVDVIKIFSTFKSADDLSLGKEQQILGVLNGVKLEPYIDNLDRIIDIIENMALVMERNPNSFSNMREEDLRTHFLVHLNGLYKGRATGETFNSNGKTDILVKGADGKNIFIAECKFWAGAKNLQNTIDQLLSYLSWRDINAAILLFNRNKDFSKVLSQIPNAILSHPNYKRKFEQRRETEFRFILRNNEDKNKEIFTTLLAFDVPL